MRAIWKGAVSFGLVNVPVRLYSATENHDIHFRQVHRTDGGRIRYKRFCSKDGQEVAYDDIAKGYETEDGEMVVLTDEDMADLPVRSSKEISVEKFVPEDQVDPMLLDKSYYLEPDKSATKPYVLLREALEREGRMAIVTVAIRSRMTLAVLRVREGVIVMQTMLWADEVRSPEFAHLDEEGEASDKEMSMARMLIDELAGDWDPDEFEDDYALAVEALVKAKLEGGEVETAAEDEEESGEVVDLLAALSKSVDKAKTARGESTSGSGSKGSAPKAEKKTAAGSHAPRGQKSSSSGTKSTAKKSSSKKAPAKKSTKKTTAKKSSSKKKAS